MSEDPEGDEIEAHTVWLTFDGGEECAISLDLTKFNVAMRRAARSAKRNP